MRRMMIAEIRNRRSRSLALLAGILVATAAFAVFTGTSDSQQLTVRGTVARSFRGSYDILVRPQGTESPIERLQGLVRDNYLSGILGEITMAQYQQIAHLPGVGVAAPIAMIGYVLQPVSFYIDLTHYLSHAPRQLFALRASRSTDRGLTHLTDLTGYEYVTSRPIVYPLTISGAGPYVGDIEKLGRGRRALICPMTSTPASTDPFTFAARGIAECWSRRRSGIPMSGGPVLRIDWSVPFLLAAIDPAAEATLDGVNRTLVTGRYLRAADAPTVQSSVGGGKIDVPVLVSTRPYMDDREQITVSRLGSADAQALIHEPPRQAVAGRIPGASRGTVIVRRSYSTAQTYRKLLSTVSRQQLAVIENYWTSGPTRYRQLGPRELAPIPVHHPLSVWRSDYEFTGSVNAPIDSKLTGYRPLRAHVGLGSGQMTIHLPTLRAVGQFDPARLPGFSPLSRLPQETYNPPVAAPADGRTRRLLHGRDLLPDANLTGYLQAPPLLLTTLNSILAFTDPTVFPNGNISSPISVIRVRVAGVHGDDPLSRERVRLVAQRIAQTTGLRVDITIGSSPTPVRVDLPATGQRPVLEVSEGWVKKGVAVAILTALNRQSAILFLLILVVCALFVSNAASASVQARRSQLGILASLGWDSRKLFTIVLGELAAIGLAAGILGAVIALPTAAAAGFHASLVHALLAIPAAVILALLAGIMPALRASRMTPTAAVRPVVLDSGRAWRARGVSHLALINLVRVPGRSALAALSLTLGVAALTLLLAGTVVFHNALTGTLLGSAISLQVRASDYAAVVVIVVLAGAGVADVLYLNLRERATKIATLHAAGWPARSLARLVGTEALWLGLLGSLLGAALGIAGASAFASTLPPGLILVAGAAAVAGTLVAIVAAIVPALLIGRLPTVPLLAGE